MMKKLLPRATWLYANKLKNRRNGMYNVRQILNDFMSGVGKVSEIDGSFVKTFLGFDGSAGGELPDKTKELIGVAIGAYNRCQYCIVVHVYNAYKAGATKKEIIEAAEVAIAFGGGPSMAYTATVLIDAANEFEHDFD